MNKLKGHEHLVCVMMVHSGIKRCMMHHYSQTLCNSQRTLRMVLIPSTSTVCLFRLDTDHNGLHGDIAIGFSTDSSLLLKGRSILGMMRMTKMRTE